MNSIEEEQEEYEKPELSLSAADDLAAAATEKAPRYCGDHDDDRTQPLLLGGGGVVIRGVLFSRSIRSTYACLHLYPLSEEEYYEQENSSSSGDEEEDDNDKDTSVVSSSAKPLLVRLQFEERMNESLSSIRSHIRRQFKMGDLLSIVRQQAPVAAAEAAPAPATTTRRTTTSTTTLLITDDQHHQAQEEEDRVILHVTSILEATRHVRVDRFQYWKMGRVQQVQAAHRQFLVGEASIHYSNNNNNNNQTNKKPEKLPAARPSPCLNGHDDSSQQHQQQNPRFAGSRTTPEEEDDGGGHHGGGALEKRKLALYMANFVLHMTMNQIVETTRRQRQKQQQQQQQELASCCYGEDYVGLDPSQWATTCPWQAAPHALVRDAIQHLNSAKAAATTTTNAAAKEQEASNSYDNGTTTTTAGSSSCDGGVLDVAGGSGLVSMALGLLFGVRSTVVDPRPSVGKLPRRDRRMYQRAMLKGHADRHHDSITSRRPQKMAGDDLEETQQQTNENGPSDSKKNDNQTTGARQQQQQQQPENYDGDFWSSRPLYCQPIQFDTRRAWFGERILASTSTNDPQPEQSVVGQKPSTRDSSGNDDGHENDRLLSSCSAIVALHPDQATDAVVEVALRQEIPFVVVPCCVFSRLFPHRRRPQPTGNNRRADDNLNNEKEQPVDLTVNTRLQLIRYLQAKDDRILRVDLPFIGANTVLWCTF